ncbi:MAG: hypothetical protein Q9190_001949 [Brigantiaea leucoxantha]
MTLRLTNLVPVYQQEQQLKTALRTSIANLDTGDRPRVISQWHIDNITAAVAVVASKSNLQATSEQQAMIYIALCRIVVTILTLHRQRLGGRYHLLLPALQSLLRCLFIPYSYPPVPVSAHPYTVTHAASFTRILTMLCSPTVSAVSRRSKREQRSDNHILNDPTKKAKITAGKNLHYLIMTYCHCQTEGRLTFEVKRKLEPGLWAMLEVVPMEVLRTMNAGMDAAGRGIWKGLWEEWRRSTGKGKL